MKSHEIIIHYLRGTTMKSSLLSSLLLAASCSLFLAAESSAQCTFKLVDGGNILDTFTESGCSHAGNRCNRKLNRLRHKYPGSYRHAYCTADNASHSSNKTIVRSYDRCQAPGVVRCTAHYSDGSTTTEDYSCSGCIGYGNPAGDPCGWRCSFPQVY